MEYLIESKSLEELLNLYCEGKLDLTPAYQRNSVWTTNAQSDLIDSIRKNFPLPTFFIRTLENNKFEMVDGQQRTRAILKYFKTNDLNESITEDLEFKEKLFRDYKIPVSFITKLESDERIEDFYHRVNSTGLHLNRPEKIKSKYLRTNIFQLSERILNSTLFGNLDIFTTASRRRMLDRDFIEEIIALIHGGISDKKHAVDKMYQLDFSEEETTKIEEEIESYLDVITEFDNYYPIAKTRYKQRNDLYTVFSFLKKNKHLPLDLLKYFYKIMVVIDKEIKPTDKTCPILKDYAINCVSQSNSKDARVKRLNILEGILYSDQDSYTQTQEDIIEYYNIQSEILIIEDFRILNVDDLKKSIDQMVVDRLVRPQ